MTTNKLKLNEAKKTVYLFSFLFLFVYLFLFLWLNCFMHLGAFGALQKVKNWAARIATGCNRQDHTTTCLTSLNWLSVLQRIAFKISLLMLYYHQAIWLHLSSDTSHSVFSDIYRPDRSLLYQEPSKKKYGSTSFSYAGPAILNSLSLCFISHICYNTSTLTFLLENPSLSYCFCKLKFICLLSQVTAVPLSIYL